MKNTIKIPNFSHTGFNSPITEFSILLVGVDRNKRTALGSGIIIGGNIAITATHVVDAFFAEHQGNTLDDPGDADFSIMALQFLQNGTKVQSWDVRKLWAAQKQQTDITFLLLLRSSASPQQQESYPWRKLRMKVLPPPVGSIVSAFGYHSNQVEWDGNTTKVITNPYSSTGRIEEIHGQARDSVVLPFPCFRTNARFDPAMSGGPVFSDDGCLCGLVCSNLPPDPADPGGEHVSYVTTLWPCLAIPVSYNRVGYPADVFYPAYELAKSGHLDVVDLDSVQITRHDDSVTVAVPAMSILSRNTTC